MKTKMTAEKKTITRSRRTKTIIRRKTIKAVTSEKISTKEARTRKTKTTNKNRKKRKVMFPHDAYFNLSGLVTACQSLVKEVSKSCLMSPRKVHTN